MAASSLDRRTAGFKLGDGREYQKPAKHVSRLRGNDYVVQDLNPIDSYSDLERMEVSRRAIGFLLFRKWDYPLDASRCLP